MFEDILSKEQYAAIKKIIPSETLLIPSATSLKNMAGYKVRKGEGLQNIDSTLIANLKSIFGSIYMLSNNSGDETRQIQRVRNAVRGNFEVGANALRRSLSGGVVGSIESANCDFVACRNINTRNTTS